jgi:Uma2 family endonuclease
MISVEEFDRLEEDEFRYELDEGELLTLTRPGVNHGRIERRLIVALQSYFDLHPIGEVLGSDVLFMLGPTTKRAPDVSVLLRSVGDVKDIPGAPELAIEILSPSNTARAMRRKIGQYFASGCRLVWVVNPKTRSVDVWDSPGGVTRTIRESEALTAPELLPGFTLPVARLF